MRACPIASDEASLQPSSDGPWEGGVGGGAWWFEVAVAATAASCCSRRPPAAVKGAWLGRPEGSMTRRRLAARSEGWTRRSAVREALHDEKLSGRGEVHWSERGLWPARCAVTGGQRNGCGETYVPADSGPVVTDRPGSVGVTQPRMRMDGASAAMA